MSKRSAKDLLQDISESIERIISYTRDKLIHDYFGVNIDIVWDIVLNEIPDLRLKIKNIINR